MKHHTLKAEKRELTGRKVKRLRQVGLIPATVYGKGLTSQTIQVKEKELLSVYEEAGETGLVDLELGSKKHPSLISNIQTHPVTSNILHVDFREVDLTQKVKAMVPVEIIGESPAEKQGLGTVVLMLDEVEVEALPEDLPESFEVNAETLLEVEDIFDVSDLAYDNKKIEILTAPEQILAKVEPPQKEEVIETPIVTETTVQGSDEKPAEGEEASDTSSEKPVEEK